MFRKVSIYDIAELNNSNINKDDNFTFINYLDTGNITKNIIDSLQLLETKNDKIPSRAKRKVKQKTIIYSTVRPNQEHYGFIDNSIENLIVSTGFTTIDCIDPDVNAKFLYYYLSQNHIVEFFQGIAENSVSSYPSMKPEDIGNLLVKVPADIQEQKKIASIFSTLDKKIALNNQINQELEAMAKTLYDYWFVQFDFPNEEGKPYKSSGGKMVYSEELKREIPEGWEAGTLSQISELVRGVSYTKNDIKTSEDRGCIPILRATNIEGNKIDLDDMVYVPSEFVSEKQILNKYEILFVMSSGSINHIGKNALYFFDKKVAFGAFCAKLVAKDNFKYYLYSYTQSDFLFSTIKNECLGTNINNLNGALVDAFKVVISPNRQILKFNEKVEALYLKLSTNYIENQKLTQLRDWLLPMLMNGQVSVADAKEQVNELMVAEPEQAYGKS